MTRSRQKPAFTLLELVLVLVIAATTLAIAAPNLRGWRKGAELRGSMDELLALTRLARTEAISKGRTYRLEFDQELHFQLKMQVGLQVVEVPGSYGKQYSLPPGSRLNIRKDQVASEYETKEASVIEFFPSGRTQPATITVTDSQNYEMVVQCTAPAGNFRHVSEGAKQ